MGLHDELIRRSQNLQFAKEVIEKKIDSFGGAEFGKKFCSKENFSERTTTISRSNFKVIEYEHKHFEKIPLPLEEGGP